MRRTTKTAFCRKEQRTRSLLWLSHAVNFCFVRNSLRRIVDVGGKSLAFFFCCFQQEALSIGIQNHQRRGRRHQYACTASRKFLQCLSISWTWARFLGKTFINHLMPKKTNTHTHKYANRAFFTNNSGKKWHNNFCLCDSRARETFISDASYLFLWPLLCIAKHSTAAINFLIFSSKKVIWLIRWMGSMTLQPKLVCVCRAFIRSFHSCCARCCTHQREW